MAFQEPITLFTLTDLLNYRNCAGYAWLVRHQPERAPDVSDPTTRRKELADADLRQLVRQHLQVTVSIDTDDHACAAHATSDAMKQGALAIAGATVVTSRRLVARADVLRWNGQAWDLLLVHATTSVKTDHAVAAVYIARAFAEAGIEIGDVRLVHLRKAYRRGQQLEVDQLLAEEDLRPRMGRVGAGVARDVDAALVVLGDAGRPAICRCDLGTRNARCPTFGLFHPTIGAGDTVYDLGGISGRKLEGVLARGILRLVDWPDDIEVSARQRRQIEAQRSGREYIEPLAIQSFLSRLEYPLHFLDYETFQLAVPQFEHCLPWSQVPFQYSVHVLQANGHLGHREFLATTPGALPVADLVGRLRSDIGDRGSVVVWNQGFEQSRNRDMAEMLPEAAGFLNAITSRMVDLMDIVRDGAWVHPAFGGSASIKKVLPVAAPNLSYDQLEIGEGMLAAEQWVQAVMREPHRMGDNERAAVFRALREYCQRDTLAMVLVLQHLQQMLQRMEGRAATLAAG